jgi:hypothetical protein
MHGFCELQKQNDQHAYRYTPTGPFFRYQRQLAPISCLVDTGIKLNSGHASTDDTQRERLAQRREKPGGSSSLHSNTVL